MCETKSTAFIIKASHHILVDRSSDVFQIPQTPLFYFSPCPSATSDFQTDREIKHAFQKEMTWAQISLLHFIPGGSTAHFPENHTDDILARVSQMLGPRGAELPRTSLTVLDETAGCQWEWKEEEK